VPPPPPTRCGGGVAPPQQKAAAIAGGRRLGSAPSPCPPHPRERRPRTGGRARGGATGEVRVGVEVLYPLNSVALFLRVWERGRGGRGPEADVIENVAPHWWLQSGEEGRKNGRQKRVLLVSREQRVFEVPHRSSLIKRCRVARRQGLDALVRRQLSEVRRYVNDSADMGQRHHR